LLVALLFVLAVCIPSSRTPTYWNVGYIIPTLSMQFPKSPDVAWNRKVYAGRAVVVNVARFPRTSSSDDTIFNYLCDNVQPKAFSYNVKSLNRFSKNY
jgi:hypothetical protein